MWEQVTKMSFKRKQAHVVMDPSQPAKQDGNNIIALSQHPYILCHFANYAHHKILYTHIRLFE